jgi:hypothetical protein
MRTVTAHRPNPILARSTEPDPERVFEIICSTFARLGVDHMIVNTAGRDVTDEVIEERSRNAAQALVALYGAPAREAV